MSDLLVCWIPVLFLLAVLAGAAWGAIGVSAGSPGWGSISGFLGLFLLGGAVASYVPLRALRSVLEVSGVSGRDFWELAPSLRPGVDLIWAGLDQAVQLILLGLTLALAQWPRRAALRAAVALGLGSVFCRAIVAIYFRGAEGVAAGDLANQLLGASAAAFMLGSLFGAGHKLAAWLTATLALALTTWAGQELPLAARPLAGIALLFAADRLLWSWRVGESEGVERLYPLWRAAYEVHRQWRGARRLVGMWSQVSWRERIFRALGSWLFALSGLALALALPALLAYFIGSGGPEAWRLLAGVASGAFVGVGLLGMSWSAAGWHASTNPQWAFLAGIDIRSPVLGEEEWRRRVVTYLCITIVGIACGLASGV